MKLSTAFVLIPFLLIVLFSKELDKNVDKEVKDQFGVTSYSSEGVVVPIEMYNSLPSNISERNFFRITKDANLLGYVYVDKAPSKTAEFDYLIILDKDLKIARTKVLVYREEYGGEIGSKRWLRQFTGKSSAKELHHIAAISGATISVRSMKKAVQDFLTGLEVLKTSDIL